MFSIHVQPGGVALNKKHNFSDVFNVEQGVLQGEPLSPLLLLFRYTYMFLKFSSLNQIAEMLVFKSYHCI